jgi:hypothetical protein
MHEPSQRLSRLLSENFGTASRALQLLAERVSRGKQSFRFVS